MENFELLKELEEIGYLDKLKKSGLMVPSTFTFYKVSTAYRNRKKKFPKRKNALLKKEICCIQDISLDTLWRAERAMKREI